MFLSKNTIFVFLCLFGILFQGKTENIDGTIEFSDGTKWQGKIQFPKIFKVHDKNQLQSISSEKIQEIQFSVEKKEMTQAFWFPEPGKPTQEKSGSPYPVIHLRSFFVFWDGSQKQGHLYTTVLYLTKEEQTKKLILFYKMRGKEKENWESVVYPKKIIIGKTKPTDVLQSSHSIEKTYLPCDVCLVSKQNFARCMLKQTEENFSVPEEYQQEGFFLAIQKQNRILVQWEKKGDKKTTILVQSAIPFVSDFFDDKKLLEVFQSKEDTIYSLMLLQRKSKTTLDAEKKYPWRMEIWRWKYDLDENRLMLASRQYFFRGILSKNEEAPCIQIEEDLLKKSFKEKP